MSEKLRLFIASDISEEQREKAAELIKKLKKGAQFTKAHPRWVRPENLHLTMQFLGDVESEKVVSIVEAVQSVIKEAEPFEFGLKGLGVFPNRRQPKVLWVGLSKGEKFLAELQADLREALGPLGFEGEKRRFHGHITLARIKALRGAGALMKIVDDNDRESNLGLATSDHLSLYQSKLTPEGSIYKVLHRWPLGASSAAEEPHARNENDDSGTPH